MTWVYNATPEEEAASQWPRIVGVCISLTTLMSLVVAARLVLRIRGVGGLGIGDWVILASAACGVVYNALAIQQTRYGLALPVGQRPLQDDSDYKIINYAGRPIYMFAILGFKVVLCISYLHMVRHSSRRIYHIAIWIVLISCIIAHFVGTLILILQCNPPARLWAQATHPGTCLSHVLDFYALGATSILFDVVIFALPIPLIRSLHIARNDKLGLAGLCILCCITLVASCFRMAGIHENSVNGDSTSLVLWGTIEANIGIMLSALPQIVPMLRGSADELDHNSLRLSESLRLGSLSDTLRLRSANTCKPAIGSSHRDSLSSPIVSDKATTKATTASTRAEEQPESDSINDVVSRVIHRATEIDVYEVYWPNAQRQAAIDERW